MNCTELAAAEECAPAPRYSVSPLPAGPHVEGAHEPPVTADGPCATEFPAEHLKLFLISPQVVTRDNFRSSSIILEPPSSVTTLFCHVTSLRSPRLLLSLYHSSKNLFRKFFVCGKPVFWVLSCSPMEAPQSVLWR